MPVFQTWYHNTPMTSGHSQFKTPMKKYIGLFQLLGIPH